APRAIGFGFIARIPRRSGERKTRRSAHLKRVAEKLGASASANFCLSSRRPASSDRVGLLQAFAEADWFVAEIGARFTVIEVGVLHDAGDRIPRENRFF